MKGSLRYASPWLVALATALPACGGSAPPAESPADQAEVAESTPPESAAAESEPDTAAPPSDAAAEPKSPEEPADPPFTENMSVSEAIKVVPPGADRANLDPETLGKPLQNVELYEPCKPGTAKVKLAVAIWNGKAVGVDVTTSPKNERLSDCIKAKVRELSWDKKVKSLNTIEYQL